MLPKILLFFGLFLFCSNIFGQTRILVSPNQELYQIGKRISFYEDNTKKLELNDILVLDKEFQISKQQVPNWGLSSAHIWIKIQVQDTSNQLEKWYLNLDYSTLRTANLYYQDTSKNWQVIESGNRVAFQKRQVKSRNFIFPLHLPTNGVHTFYLNLSNAGPIQAPLFIQNMNSIYYEQTKMEMYYGVLTGIFILIIVGNFFLWINLKDPAYFFYIVYALGSLLTLLYISGHATQYVLSAYPRLSGTAIGVFISLIIIGLPLFTKNFLHLKNRVLVHTLNGIGAIGVCFILYVVLVGYQSLMIIAGMILLALTTLLAFIIGVYSLLVGEREARFFVLGFGIYFVGMTVLILRFLDVVPINSFTNHIVELASIFEIFIISLALIDKYGIQIKKAKQNLEQKVHERTLKLSTTNEKLREQDEKLHKNIETLESVQGQMKLKQQELQDTNEVLQLKNTQIDRSILAAEHIQKAMLPYKGKIEELLKQYFIIYRPKDVVSGDFYWVNQMDGKTIVATVDCTGHGVPGAMMSMIGSNLLDRIIRIWENSSPAEILTLLHKQIHLVLRQKYTKNNYGMDITVISLEEMGNTYKLTFSGAKTSLYYHENNSTELKELKGTRKSIGGKQNETKQFENQSITLEKGSTIYMLTDGLQDQQDSEQEKLGSHRLKEFLVQHINLSLVEQKIKLEQMIEERLENVEQRDDMLVFVCKLS